ncbi:heavy-metal-associated domain-containing protein [Sulfitobacter pseudonitzschiae]|uniref:Heavy-metal-associated domain-containing protein n=1 Tax=Pseudosulfitobacter pseudonitzschiae TaxID=1402135 RepID=A0A9Q2NSP0_9RHOB|nr:heavy-metal-associated domain-containing protein [Pseudosulfitobacter pseudonitzschiae]MBM2294390.1 heavy-metal-associated domain-containing protein [Pseudosulfitobacter pseudonitzschiae]MBM2299315.1 heavy-metal-associated domain-containing protein [Pseudosulfitobacter pseudonitzschiae]MBM2304222.1 heavy-metal-associated domain-containing protein [Pseudosulfitobacter pseudonitzschiae]MBM2314002.1 heavy-metal-associated domain-containing protein [Pseudosulfitobacter pseudonitzschiae]MBM23189
MSENIITPTAARFHVPDMTCGHCEKSVRGALAQVLPDAAVTVDLSTHMVQVAGDAETARTALEGAGFTPTVA